MTHRTHITFLLYREHLGLLYEWNSYVSPGFSSFFPFKVSKIFINYLKNTTISYGESTHG